MSSAIAASVLSHGALSLQPQYIALLDDTSLAESSLFILRVLNFYSPTCCAAIKYVCSASP